MPSVQPVFIIAVLLIASVIAGKIAGRFGIPALLLFLAIGMAAGSDGPGGIEFTDAELASSVGAVALAFILFSGGLDTRWDSVRRVLTPGVLLATWGTFVTAIAAGLAATLIFDLPLLLGLLLGAIISSTDAAAVFSVLRSRDVGLRGRLRPLLEFESASNDPMAVFLTIGFTTLFVDETWSIGNLGVMLVQQAILGAVFGILMAHAALWVINHIRLEYEGLYSVLTVSVVLLVYSATTAVGGSGFLAVYLAGLTMSRGRLIHRRSLMRFHDAVGWLMQITMFLLLGLLVFPSRLVEVAVPGIGLALVLMLVVRPLAVFLSVYPRSWSLGERTLVSWVGLRGAVPIILATFPLAIGVDGAELIFDAVFFVVLLSVALQGPTIPAIARLLRVSDPGEPHSSEREEIIGGSGTGRYLSDIKIPEGSWAEGRQVVELDLPEGAWLVMLVRGGEVLVPQGPTILESGDTLTVLATEREMRELQAMLGVPGHWR